MPIHSVDQSRLVAKATLQLEEAGWSAQQARRLVFARLRVSAWRLTEFPAELTIWSGHLIAQPQFAAVYRPLDLEF